MKIPRSFDALPIRRKLTLLVTASGSAAVALACAGFLAYFIVSYRERLVTFATAASRIVGDSSAASLMFNDPKAAERILASLSAAPHVNLARIYANDGRPFATYRSPGVTLDPPAQPGPDGHRFTFGHLAVVEGIFLAGHRVGTICTVEDLGGMHKAILVFLGIAAVILLAGSLAAFGIAALFQRIISEPILELARAAQDISKKGDYSVRVVKRSGDELGTLVDCFNGMLGQIAAHDRALRSSQKELKDIMDYSPAMIFTKRPDGRYLFVNRKYQHVIGRAQEEIIGKSPDELWPSQFARTLTANDRATLETGGPMTFEEQVPGQSGLITFLSVKFALRDALGAPYALCGIALDITERKKGEAERQRAMSLLQATLESTADGILVVDRDGKLAGFNQRFVQMWRIPPEILATHEDGRAIACVLEQLKEPSAFLAKIRDLYASPTAESLDVLEFKDGRVFERFSKAQMLGAEPVGRVWSFRDVTQRRRAEDEVRRLNADLERRVADRTTQLRAANEELESFSYSTSHDLRAPLRSIDGFSSIALEEYGDKLGQPGKALLQRIRGATLRMAAIIDDMLNLSRVTRCEMRREKVDLSALARNVMAGLQRSAPGRKAVVEIQQGLEVNGDSSLLQLMLENLLGNAWKYSSKTPQARIELGMKSDGGHRVYYVRDNGAGFDPAYVGKLFQPFVRLHTSEEFPGTGVGLTIVSRIVARHGGQVWAKGAVGKGATFYFELHEAAHH